MSNSEILSLKSGRDLDVKAALNLMGYLWITHLLRFSAEMAVKWIGTRQELDAAGGVLIAVKPADFQELKYREDFDQIVPPYSTDPEQSAKIIEKMAELGFTYTAEQTDTADAVVYFAGFSKAGTPDTTARAGGSNLPEAIVKAALLATV